ncbi:MAG: hypothetical protein SFT81_03235 [Candidatus Caenarcaniphilales bacterium]|nr:hypothetical protein [Candidatus Caenarcaniphilales bacterium]
MASLDPVTSYGSIYSPLVVSGGLWASAITNSNYPQANSSATSQNSPTKIQTPQIYGNTNPEATKLSYYDDPSLRKDQKTNFWIRALQIIGIFGITLLAIDLGRNLLPKAQTDHDFDTRKFSEKVNDLRNKPQDLWRFMLDSFHKLTGYTPVELITQNKQTVQYGVNRYSQKPAVLNTSFQNLKAELAKLQDNNFINPEELNLIENRVFGLLPDAERSNDSIMPFALTIFNDEKSNNIEIILVYHRNETGGLNPRLTEKREIHKALVGEVASQIEKRLAKAIEDFDKEKGSHVFTTEMVANEISSSLQFQVNGSAHYANILKQANDSRTKSRDTKSATA